MKVGILGAGTIVPDFLLAQSYIEQISVKAICGMENDMPKMEEFKKTYSIEKIYIDYDEMLKDEDIDTIYVAVPNSLHHNKAKQALDAGKNVIVEKPFTSNKEEAEDLINLAKQKHLFLFDAAANIYCPNYLKVKEFVNNLGDVKIVQINYSQYSRRYDQFKAGVTLPVFDPKKAGGALMDLNVYGTGMIVDLFGKPEHVYYFANIEKGVDTSGILILEYKNFKAESIAAKDCKAPCSINIQGDKAYIHSDESPNCFNNFVYSTNDGQSESYSLNEHKIYERMYYELIEFASVLDRNDWEKQEKMFNHTLDVIDTLDKARDYAGISFK